MLFLVDNSISRLPKKKAALYFLGAVTDLNRNRSEDESFILNYFLNSSHVAIDFLIMEVFV